MLFYIIMYIYMNKAPIPTKLKWLVFLLLILVLGTYIIFISLKTIVLHCSPNRVYDNSFNSSTKDTLLILNCSDKKLVSTFTQRGNFMILKNYVRARKTFQCNESVTYTTPADFRFLDNLVAVVEKWKGPVSVALYAPGNDFHLTVDSIAYLRECATTEIKEYVTFHVIFEADHFPTQLNKPLVELYEDKYNCSKGPPYENFKAENMYKMRHNLTYPINVVRNVARESSQTHFVFPSDVELYPTPNFIQKFFTMITKNRSLIRDSAKNVFVLPIFEIPRNEKVPQNKTELQRMTRNKRAFVFHKSVCRICHQVPNASEWLNKDENGGLSVFMSSKRRGKYKYWEPFYVGTKNEPFFDERLSWEGQGNKMSQAYSMCVLDYNFLILDNAFLIHKPGIKRRKVQMVKYRNIIQTNKKILAKIRNELATTYGETQRCS